MKIGSLIVTYNPDIKSLEKNIKNIKEQVEECLVVDNGSENAKFITEISQKNDVAIVNINKNVGIAAAQNVGFEYFKKNNFDWVLTLDQDSLVPQNIISTYLRSEKIRNKTTGIITSRYYDRNWSNSQKKAIMGTIDSSLKVTPKKFVISSGNLVRLSAWKTVSGFDEFLFIDMVDYDFDAKLILAGYKIWQINEVVMNHAVGTVLHKPILEKVLLLPETGLLADHPAFRQYYIYRNSIIFEKRFPMFGRKRFLILRSFIATRRMFVYKNTLSKFKASWRGIIDGARYDPQKDKVFLKTIEIIKKDNRRSDANE